MKLGFVPIAWLVLVLLAAFVIFVECIADVGTDEAIPRPPQTSSVISSPYL